VQVNSYHLGSGVGGAGPGNRNGCANPSEIAGIGTMAHEFGHAIGLPDLYDTGPAGQAGQGIGEWGLMGSGGYTSANSPTHMEAWSKEQLGWVAVVPAAATGSYAVSPIVSHDSVLMVRPPPSVANPRGEYFLLENRQALGSDTANMLSGGNGGPKYGGLLIWHVDSLKLVSGGGVNAGPIHGLALEQADGLGQLDLTADGNRGDGGDPYPGTTANTVFGYASAPAARLNADGSFTGFTLDSIRQVVPGGGMAVRLRFGSLLVRTVGPGAISSSPEVRADTVLAPGTVVTLVAVPDPGALFQGWSGDTTATNDTLIVTITGTTGVTATFAAQLVAPAPVVQSAVMGVSFGLALTATGGTGFYSWQLVAGALPPGVTLQGIGLLSGVPEATGDYSGTVQVTSGAQSLAIPVAISVTAPALATSRVLGALLGTGDTLTADERRYLDLLGNRNDRFDVGDFHAFVVTTGGAVSAAAMAEVVRKGGGR
jgi:hypothetical protein